MQADNHEMGGQRLLRPLARSPHCHLVVTGTAADTLLFIQWYAGSGGGWEERAGELRAGGQQPLGELLTVYTIVYSSVIKNYFNPHLLSQPL